MMNKAPTKYPLNIQYVLRHIKDEMQQVKQWSEMDLYKSAAECTIRLEAFVEFLEELDCGSVGGYGSGQFSCNEEHDSDLFKRATWLISKYENK